MSNNKLVKFLIILNGLMLPILLGFGIFQLAKELWPKPSNQERGLIVGEELEKAKKDSIAWQGLSYGEPNEIYNSENLLVKVSLKNYKNPKMLLNGYISYANDYNYNGFLNDVNVIFLDENYEVIRSLLDKKASVLSVNFKRPSFDKDEEVDKNYRHITYQIGYEDTNNDGELNSEDNHDLYISDLSGGNLTRVTKDVDVIQWRMIDSNSKIFIGYKERNGLKEEHRNEKFAIYSIEKNELTKLESLNSEIKKLEKIIRE